MGEGGRMDDFCKRIFSSLSAWISPFCCDICGAEREKDAFLCPDCLAELRENKPPYCLRCGHPLRITPGMEQYRQDCSNCQGRVYHFSKARSVYLNEGAAHDLVLKLKYGRALHLAPLFAASLAEYVKSEPDWRDTSWVVVSVPQSLWRRCRRGYNQAEEIARVLARLGGWQYRSVLKRSWRSRSQTTMNRRDRLKANLRTVSVRRKYVGDESLATVRFLLIDDVLTTASTLNECARALKAAFPQAEVTGLTFLRSE